MNEIPVRILFGYKIFKALLVLLMAFGLYGTVVRHLPRPARSVLEQVTLPQEKEFYGNLASTVAGMVRGMPSWLGHWGFWAGLVAILQAVGMWRRIPPLLWLLLAESVFFLCLGLFALTRRFDLGAAIVTGIFGLIVWYFLQNRAQFLSGGGGSGSSGPKKPKKEKD